MFVKIMEGGGTGTDPIQVKSRLKQGVSMSPIIFNLILEKVVRKTDIQSQDDFKLQESVIALLTYVDDLEQIA